MNDNAKFTLQIVYETYENPFLLHWKKMNLLFEKVKERDLKITQIMVQRVKQNVWWQT